MSISIELKNKFEKILEIQNVDWQLIDNVSISDANILRPIKGVCFETFFAKIINSNDPQSIVKDGGGDSDVDKIINNKTCQLKTIDKGSTKTGAQVAVALHKTHGNEKRPYNLYNISNPTFQYLVVLHPSSGILIIPFSKIPRHNKWNDYLDDPARFSWQSKWLNRWELLGLQDKYNGSTLDKRNIPSKSLLPNLSKITFLEDFEIIETLCKPENFRAAVMGLKGNIKQVWLKNNLITNNVIVDDPDFAYSKYDYIIGNNKKYRVQVKGTSKNMCKPNEGLLGVEVMGTHGQFPRRGYKASQFDYLAIIISDYQLSIYPIENGLHFIFVPIDDLPKHYLIKNGDNNIDSGWGNKLWNESEFSDVIYPNIKFLTKYKNDRIEVIPDLDSYKTYRGYETIPIDSTFRDAGPYIVDEIPENFSN